MSKLPAFLLLPLFALSAHASELSCFVKRELPKPSTTANAPDSGRSHIIMENGKAPILRTAGNIDKKGKLSIDPATHRQIYSFEPLIDFNSGAYWSDIDCGEMAPLYENNCYDERTFATVAVDPQNPANDTITLRVDRRTHTKVIGIGLAGLNSWQLGQPYTHPLIGCETSQPGQPSARPQSCDSASVDLDAAPVGTRCLSTANAAVFEKVVSPNGKDVAWKGPDGLEWSGLIGIHATRAQAVAACAEIGADLPTWNDFEIGQLNNFEDAVGFGRFETWGKYNYKNYWVNSDYYFTYSDRPATENKGDAMFGVAKGFSSGHSVVSDTRTDPQGAPYGTVCVWRAAH
jgi:hypothetical protein